MPEKMRVYDVLATIDPDGKAVATNVIVHRTFKTINDYFDHEYVRWLVVREHDDPVVRVIDLWATEMTEGFPYVVPWFIQETFRTSDQDFAFVYLNI